MSKSKAKGARAEGKTAPKKLVAPAAPVSATKPAAAAAPKELPLEVFVRVKKLERAGDWLPAYQPEVLHVQGDRIVKRELVSKPDVVQMVMTVVTRLIDPRRQ